MSNKIKLSDFVVDFLAENGIREVFTFMGGALAHIVDSLHGRKDIRTVVVHHEQAGAFAAEGYARENNNLGVAIATSGPGATNLITGIGSAYFDSVPCLYITGQVNTYEYKNESPVRQVGFQETDVVSIVKPITKYAVMVKDAEDILYHLEKAVYIAKSGRPGPVLVDIPLNIQRAVVKPSELKRFTGSAEHRKMQKKLEQKNISESAGKVLKMLQDSERPVILAGGGVRLSCAADELYDFAVKASIPVVTSLMGVDAFPHDSRLYAGMIGAYGNRSANFTVANSDFLLVIGSRLDTRQTGTVPSSFARAAKIVHIDIDGYELSHKRVKSALDIRADAKSFLSILNKNISAAGMNNHKSWLDRIYDYKNKYPSYYAKSKKGLVDPNYFCELLSGYAAKNAVICTDVGQNQIWAAQSFNIKRKQRMMTSGGMGSMGFAVPCAIGAWFSDRKRQQVVIVGDGGFQINIQELQTIKRNRIPLKIFLLNNSCLGMVRQFQEIYFRKRYNATVNGYSNPDFIKVVSAYGIKAVTIKKAAEAEQKIKWALSYNGPVVVEVILNRETLVDPKLMVNRPIEDQSPFLSRKELKSNMLIDIIKEVKKI